MQKTPKNPNRHPPASEMAERLRLDGCLLLLLRLQQATGRRETSNRLWQEQSIDDVAASSRLAQHAPQEQVSSLSGRTEKRTGTVTRKTAG